MSAKQAEVADAGQALCRLTALAARYRVRARDDGVHARARARDHGVHDRARARGDGLRKVYGRRAPRLQTQAVAYGALGG